MCDFYLRLRYLLFLHRALDNKHESMNHSSLNPLDISDLLFHRADLSKASTVDVNDKNASGHRVDHNSNSNQRLTYIGPISINHHIVSSHQTTTTRKGRCLVATRALDVGELLFVTPPIINANVQDVWVEFAKSRASSPSSSLAQVAENVLLGACKAAIAEQNDSVMRCLSALERSCDDSLPKTCSVRRLLGLPNNNNGDDIECIPYDDFVGISEQLSDDDILQIIRRNAFGADFPTTNRIEQRWLDILDSTGSSTHNDNDLFVDSSDSHKILLPSRLLGIYGLAAMINHSCIPNAVRVFSSNNDCMVVHTCQPVQPGEEIVWSYIPVIQPYHERQSLLQRTHNFICECPRCSAESMLFSSDSFRDQLEKLQSWNDGSSNLSIHLIENDILKQSTLSNELKRYVRMSNMQSYMNHINNALVVFQEERNIDDFEALQSLLTVAFQLHLTFVVCHNVSTEHLSILHLCYDLACMIHTKASALNKGDDSRGNTYSTQQQSRKSTTMAAVRYWTEQLKRAVLIRYGPVGNDVNVVRQLLHHTKQVVRNRDGLDHAMYKFI